MRDWKAYKLGDILKVKHGYAFKGEHFTTKENQNLLLTPGNFEMFGGIKFNWGKQKFYNGEFPNEYILAKGNLVIAMTDLTQSCDILGAPLIIKNSNFNYLHNQRLGLIVENRDLVCNEYLYHFFNTYRYRSRLIATKSGSTVSHTAPERIYDCEIDLPPLNEQHAIASILSPLDDKIELNLQMNKTLEEMAMALYKHWFVDFGPFQNGKFVESELGMIPEGWEVKTINSFGKVICGKTPSKKDVTNFCTDGGYQFLKIPDMHGKVFVHETVEMISEKGNKLQLNKLLPPGSINVSCIATVGLVTINSLPAHTNQQINSIIPDKSTFRYYLYSSMLNLKERFLNEASGGSATLNMNTSTFSSIEILKPLDDELKKFDLTVADLFEQINENSIENQTLTTLRDTLSPKLISGQISVKDAEQMLAASL